MESPQPVTFDRVVLQEDITRGQRVESFAVDVWDGTAWKTVVQAGAIDPAGLFRTQGGVL
ncbi:hypothetical protein [Streptomyces sp. NPDC087538]|uniref:hypothetical protein n=1 Tax=Streptomyces sp. NPDC087538 TaxID=3365797 RepID=UPI00381CAFEC